jgi:hypothetical protein
VCCAKELLRGAEHTGEALALLTWVVLPMAQLQILW